MKILLNSNRTVDEVKTEFTTAYPFLKIEFLTTGNDEGGDLHVADPSLLLIEVSGVLKEGDIDIKSTDTVKEVQDKFRKQYGLPAHVFRQQKGMWMDTSVTDDLTLREQNTWGREASKPLKLKIEHPFGWNNLSLGKHSLGKQ